MAKGLVHIYTGDGKGKTTAAAGLCARALGQGLRVGFFQFLKSGRSGEVDSLQKLGAQVGAAEDSGKFIWNMTEAEKEACATAQAIHLQKAAKAMPTLDLLVLDEAIGACGAGMLKEEDLLALLAAKPEHLEVVLTGRNASEALRNAADYITEMRAVRHPFDEGQVARRGIEF